MQYSSRALLINWEIFFLGGGQIKYTDTVVAIIWKRIIQMFYMELLSHSKSQVWGIYHHPVVGSSASSPVQGPVSVHYHFHLAVERVHLDPPSLIISAKNCSLTSIADFTLYLLKSSLCILIHFAFSYSGTGKIRMHSWLPL